MGIKVTGFFPPNDKAPENKIGDVAFELERGSDPIVIEQYNKALERTFMVARCFGKVCARGTIWKGKTGSYCQSDCRLTFEESQELLTQAAAMKAARGSGERHDPFA